MCESSNTPHWTRHFYYRAEHTRTTWKFRLGFLALVVVAAWLTRGWWTIAIARSLVCEANNAQSDAILVENFDPDYLVFERAARLQVAGIAPKALVPVLESRNPGVPNPVSTGIAEVMARQSRLAAWEALPIRDIEPITLNAAVQLREHLVREGVRSLLVVTGGFRSRRSTMVYRAVLGLAGIEVHCVPVFGRKTPESWTQSWHGIQEVVQQLVKLQYYRFYVVPILARTRHAADPPTSAPGAAHPARTPTASRGIPASGIWHREAISKVMAR
jgi:hypothetical protein